jgi:sulfite reductase (NADPH) flavoprotein alpha-component
MSISKNGLFSSDQKDLFIKFTESFNKNQLIWASGYLDGLLAHHIDVEETDSPDQNSSQSSQPVLTILFGSRTGNGEGLAQKAQIEAVKQGYHVSLKSMADYNVRDLHTEKNLLVIVSTHGEGEPPFAARELHEFIYSKRAPKLEALNYAVIALGDSAYFKFCQTGKDFNVQLEVLGANRISNPLLLDVDYEEPFEKGLNTILQGFNGGEKVSAKTTLQYRMVLPPDKGKNKKKQAHSKKNPFLAPVYEKILLHGKGSKRQTLHIELNTKEATELDYEPGDAAGVLPVNPPDLINEVLKITGLGPDEKVIIKGEEKSLYEALNRDVELSKITTDVVTRFLAFAPNDKLLKLSQDTGPFKEYLEGRDIVDLFQDFPATLTSHDLVLLLRPLQPRYYSISSSPKAFPGELHLTVGVVNYINSGRQKRGTCSAFLSEVSVEGEQVPVFIESNPGFRLPENDETPIIMVGAGTGIAPYRAFLQHRALADKQGKNWLFFGNRNFETEFLYQAEWQNFLKSGTLTKLDVAFSRDGEKKVYVQDRLSEKAKEVYQWLEEGAHFYICGDMKNMARNVHDTLVTIIENEGVMSKEKAREYIGNLEKEKRLQLDVY